MVQYRPHFYHVEIIFRCPSRLAGFNAIEVRCSVESRIIKRDDPKTVMTLKRYTKTESEVKSEDTFQYVYIRPKGFY